MELILEVLGVAWDVWGVPRGSSGGSWVLGGCLAGIFDAIFVSKDFWHPQASQNGARNGPASNIKPILASSSPNAFGPIIYNVLLPSDLIASALKATTNVSKRL